MCSPRSMNGTPFTIVARTPVGRDWAEGVDDEPPSASGPDLRVDRVVLSGLDVELADRSVDPPLVAGPLATTTGVAPCCSTNPAAMDARLPLAQMIHTGSDGSMPSGRPSCRSAR